MWDSESVRRMLRFVRILTELSFLCVFFARPCAADEKGSAILREAFAKMQAARTMTAKLDVTMSQVGSKMQQHATGVLVAMKPNYLRFELQGRGAPIFVSDGKYYYTWAVNAPLYQKEPVAAKPTEFAGFWEGEVDGFFGGAANVAKIAATHAGTEKVDGVECDIVKGFMKGENGAPARDVIYSIGKADRIIRRSIVTVKQPQGGGSRQVNHLIDVKFDTQKTPADFQFKPSPNAKPAPPRKRDIITVDAGHDPGVAYGG